MDNNEQWNQFLKALVEVLKALAEVQKVNDLILRDMITTFIREQNKSKQ